MECDFRCPPVPQKREGVVYCCWNCDKITNSGCSLGEDRPQKCKDYDCKDYKFYTSFQWFPEQGVWGYTSLLAVRKEDIDKKFIETYNDLFKEKENEDSSGDRS